MQQDSSTPTPPRTREEMAGLAPQAREVCAYCGGLRVSKEPLAPTIEAIDAWRAHRGANGWPSWSVDIRTRGGEWRCVTSKQEGNYVYYETIRGEGSTNGGRITYVRADKIVEARGHVLHYAEMEARNA